VEAERDDPLSEHLVSHITGRSWSDYVWASRNGPWETERLTRVVARDFCVARLSFDDT
jgi:hypothetical protein